MLKVEEARKTIFENMPEKKIGQLPLINALGCIVAEDIISPINIPAFENSAMDGYAFSVELNGRPTAESPLRLRNVIDVPAGSYWEGVLQKGECARTMTGAPVSSGADTVVMQEDVVIEDAMVLLQRSVPKGENIRFLGEDVKMGETVLAKGSKIRSQEIALLANCGFESVRVFLKPSVGVISTGDELVEPGVALDTGKIYDSNSFSLMAQLASVGIQGKRLGICRDNEEDLKREIRKGLRYDVLLISGGVSVGDYDIVKKVLVEEGVQEVFWKVAIKPGKPIFFGKNAKTLVFGVPGNPVSGYVCFEVFIRSCLLQWTGHKYFDRPVTKAILEKPISKKKGRSNFVRAITIEKESKYYTRPSGPHGSHHVKSLSQSNSFFVMDEEVDHLDKGATINVMLLDRE